MATVRLRAIVCWSLSTGSGNGRFWQDTAHRSFTPAKRGVLETAALERSGALEDRVSSRAKVRVDTLEIAQNVQIQRVRLNPFGRLLAQAHQVPLRGREFSLA